MLRRRSLPIPQSDCPAAVGLRSAIGGPTPTSTRSVSTGPESPPTPGPWVGCATPGPVAPAFSCEPDGPELCLDYKQASLTHVGLSLSLRIPFLLSLPAVGFSCEESLLCVIEFSGFERRADKYLSQRGDLVTPLRTSVNIITHWVVLTADVVS